MITKQKILSVTLLGIFILTAIFQWIHAGTALILGIILALTVGNPYRVVTQNYAGLLLKASVVGLGFSIDLSILWQETQNSFLLTLITIVVALSVGLFLGKKLAVEEKLSYLISGGTAICGGSAIAALAPTIKASQHQVVVAISIVFILNGVALYLYPYLGHVLELSQTQFGVWAALGIHDTSSVVGAASIYGDDALVTATTTKLARALWIIPLVFLASWQQQGQGAKTAPPMFILLFMIAASINTFFPQIGELSSYLVLAAKTGMVVSLLFMGAGFTKEVLKAIDLKPMLQGVILWLVISVFSFFLVYWGLG